MGNACLYCNIPATTEPSVVPIFETKQQASYQPPSLPRVINEPFGKICVVGATGKQGGAVIEALLSQKKFSVRALTRNPDSKRAQALALKGVEIVKADLADPVSLVNAFQGCYGVFAVTNFWADMNPETERQQAKNIARACKFTNIQHILWSTLEDTSTVMKKAGARQEKGYYVAHFDVKAEIDEIFRQSGVPTTCVITSFFYENWIRMAPTDYGNGYVIGMNMGKKKLSMMCLADFGRVVALVFSKPEYKGQTFGFSSDELTGAEIAALMSKHKKMDIGYNAMADSDVEKAVGFEMANMFVYYREGEATCQKLRPMAKNETLTKLTKFNDWLTANAARILPVAQM